MSHGESNRGSGGLPVEAWYVAGVLTALFSAGALVEVARLSSLRDPAAWGHLRIGAWILENRGVPHTGIYSQASHLPWRDFSWGYDAILAMAYKILGLRVVPAMGTMFRILAAAVLFLLGIRRGRLRSAVALSAVGIYALSSMGPSSTAVSVVFFGLTLFLLLEWRAEPASPVKYVLPLLIPVWANLDAGFVYGIMALAVFAIVEFARQAGNKHDLNSKNMRRDAAVMLVVCVLASGITPYGYASYPAFWQMETSAANLNIPGYSAMGFRQALDYVVLLLGMGGFLALGLRRSRDIFLIAVLGGSAALAFHAQRENWLLIVSSVAVIGQMLSGDQERKGSELPMFSQRRTAIAIPIVVSAGLSLLVLMVRSPKDLTTRVAQTFPVSACEYIRNEQLPRPLFNAYEWGGFVTWYLPEYPVAIDARRGLYPEELESDYFKVMKVDVPYQTLPAMKEARTILLPKTNVLAGGLRNVAGFRVAFEDEVAIVLLHDAKE